MNNENHALVFGIDGDTLTVRVVCYEQGGADRPCAVHYEHKWGDDETCRCTDPDCDCRVGDHGACSEIDGWIENAGPKCRTMPADECWYEHAVSELGMDILQGEFEAPPMLVKLRGWSFEEPIEASPA